MYPRPQTTLFIQRTFGKLYLFIEQNNHNNTFALTLCEQLCHLRFHETDTRQQDARQTPTYKPPPHLPELKHACITLTICSSILILFCRNWFAKILKNSWKNVSNLFKIQCSKSPIKEYQQRKLSTLPSAPSNFIGHTCPSVHVHYMSQWGSSSKHLKGRFEPREHFCNNFFDAQKIRIRACNASININQHFSSPKNQSINQSERKKDYVYILAKCSKLCWHKCSKSQI